MTRLRRLPRRPWKLSAQLVAPVPVGRADIVVEVLGVAPPYTIEA